MSTKIFRFITKKTKLATCYFLFCLFPFRVPGEIAMQLAKLLMLTFFFTVLLGFFRTLALKWEKGLRYGIMESIHLIRKNIQDSETTTHDLAQLCSFLQLVIWPHEAMVNPARATWCTDMLIPQPWRINIVKIIDIVFIRHLK